MKLKQLLLIAALVMPFSVGAAIIDNGGYTTDTDTGLSWLDLTTTAGISYIDVQDYIANDQTVDGVDYSLWHYATSAQFNQLVSNFTGIFIGETDYSTVYNDGESNGLIPLLGDTYSPIYGEGDRSYSAGFVAPDSNGDVFEAYVFANIAGDGDYRTDSQFSRSGSANYNQADYVGSFLVSGNLIATPIPAALWLFGPALLGLMGFRRKAVDTAAA